MPKRFQVAGKLWRLRRHFPFPNELQITYNQVDCHGTILPSHGQRLREEQLKEVNADRN